MKKLSIIIIALIIFTSFNSIAQKQEFVGFKLGYDVTGAGTRTGFSFFYENQLAKHHGFEVGFGQRNADELYSVYIDGNELSGRVLETYLTMPIVYKFYSNIVNLSTGFSVDYFANWKDMSKHSTYTLTDYRVNPKFSFGWIISMSKPIPLSTRFNLEPEITFNPILFNYNSYFNIALRAKYKL